jgi:hypothetical protein
LCFVFFPVVINLEERVLFLNWYYEKIQYIFIVFLILFKEYIKEIRY